MTRLAPLALALTLGLAPDPSPTPTAAPSAPPAMIDLRFLRMKISAGDLYSAESILQIHRAEKGEDGEYLLGMAWLARGAALLGDWRAASRYASAARDLALARLGNPPDWENPAGSAVRVGNRDRGRGAGARRVGPQSRRDPPSRREREEVGQGALQPARPDLEAPQPDRARRTDGAVVPHRRPRRRELPGLEALRGKPVVLFFWWESCGDCKAEAAAFRRIAEKYVPRGVAFVAPTRYLRERRPERRRRRSRRRGARSTASPAAVPVPISDEAMVRYGVSATPTFVFVDRNGIVSAYLPYRMTEERLTAEIEKICRGRLARRERRGGPPDEGRRLSAPCIVPVIRSSSSTSGTVRSPGSSRHPARRRSRRRARASRSPEGTRTASGSRGTDARGGLADRRLPSRVPVTADLESGYGACPEAMRASRRRRCSRRARSG